MSEEKYHFAKLSTIEWMVDKLIEDDPRTKKLMEKGITRDELIGFRIYEQFMDDSLNESAVTKIRVSTNNIEEELRTVAEICAPHYNMGPKELKNYVERVWAALE